jgi:NAD(P)-dependent dehydrogenase (short-subunit alcohol dehydrogenase family)
MPSNSRNMVDLIRQSPPIDLSEPYDPNWVSGKTILITGGASGFGEVFFRKWAAHGANVIIGDISDKRGKALVEEVRASTGNKNHHYIHCDVTIWQSQVDFFHQAVKLSPTGGIDSVVANAGISGSHGTPFWDPKGLDADNPPPPDMKCLEVNLIGVTYTVHLALFYLARNPNSAVADPTVQPRPNRPDRHMLLIGSLASVTSVPGLTQYNAAKHGVLGLFRSLRSTAFMGGMRINIVLPYFVNTPLLSAPGRMLLAGTVIATPEDVVEAGTRFMADSRIVGRALMVGPKVKLSPDDEWEVVSQKDKDGVEVAIREVYVDDFEVVEAFVERIIRLLNFVEAARGWSGWLSDIFGVIVYRVLVILGLRR